MARSVLRRSTQKTLPLTESCLRRFNQGNGWLHARHHCLCPDSPCRGLLEAVVEAKALAISVVQVILRVFLLTNFQNQWSLQYDIRVPWF